MGTPTTSVADAIKRDVSILDYAQSCGFTVTQKGGQYSLAEHDSVRIDPDKNIFYRHSNESGGSVIDFAMQFQNVDCKTAISMLRKELARDSVNEPRPTRPMPTKEPEKPRGDIDMPPRTQGKFSRVFAYLNKTRNISPKVINDMIKRGHLYEAVNDKNHNCAFVGFDKDGKPAFGCLRGTSTYMDKPFRRDMANSNKEVAWYINNNASKLFVCEAPIDAMSIMTMLESNGIDYTKFDYLALGGTAQTPIKYHLERLPAGQIRTIYLATDNDDAGNTARAKLRSKLCELGFKGEVKDKPPRGKDWNDDLKAGSLETKSEHAQTARNPQHPQIERSIQP